MNPYRLGVVPYLNAEPLVYHFLRHPHPEITWTTAVPSRLIPMVLQGELDAALVSSFACLENADLAIVPGAGICTEGTADSIRLFCKVEPPKVRRLALDDSSRSGAALAQVLMAECFCTYPRYTRVPPHLKEMLAANDAALLIGDPAMQAFYGEPARTWGLQVLDLGEVWHALTNLPFVFGVWAARRDADLGPVPALLAEAREEARPHLNAIADAAAARLNLPRAVCRNYLHHVMRYDLGPREFEGLARFRELCIRHRLLPPDAPALRFLGE
ncbi:MAG: menaquinone biosynthesis protein [Armatimonadota bacterium]|nr:menaquinone biosynthesis protein [Armatimonadota bacterium]